MHVEFTLSNLEIGHDYSNYLNSSQYHDIFYTSGKIYYHGGFGVSSCFFLCKGVMTGKTYDLDNNFE